MTQSLEAPALFDLDSEGQLVLPSDQTEETVAATAIDFDDWAGGRQLSQADKAMIVVAPHEVSVRNRAGHLINALNDISESNSRNGFAKAAGSPDHRPEIEERYGDHTDGIVDGAAYKALTGERRARYEFFAATGLGKLALATADTPLTAYERVARRAMNDSWDAFLGQYGGTGRQIASRRNAYKKLLNKQIEYTSEDS